MAVKEILNSGYQWVPDGEGVPMDIPYERKKLHQFWKLHKGNDFGSDEELMEAYRVFEPEGVARNE